ncbi:MAG: sugar transferase, partial [Gemmatimonadaceae bacterium]
MKRFFDVTIATLGLLVTGPAILLLMTAVWLYDRHMPLYLAPRVGLHGKSFRMVKLRSMIVGADRTQVDSTADSDPRITPVGRSMRRCKLDELPQLWNVLRGDMSFVGPRPNVRRETDLYTAVERRLLDAKPGITDFGSIVYADLGDILRGQIDPNIAYNQLVRPGKSTLGIFYVEHQTLWTDLQLCWLTMLAMVSRPRSLAGVQRLMRNIG